MIRTVSGRVRMTCSLIRTVSGRVRMTCSLIRTVSGRVRMTCSLYVKRTSAVHGQVELEVLFSVGAAYSRSFSHFSFSSALKKRLSTIASTVASAMPFKEKCPILTDAPLMPITRTTVVRIILLGLE